jgi:hypothetical protein
MTFTRVKNFLTDGGEDCSCVTIKFSFTHAIYAYLKVLSLFFSHLKHDFQDMSNNASFFARFFFSIFVGLQAEPTMRTSEAQFRLTTLWPPPHPEFSYPACPGCPGRVPESSRRIFCRG